MANNALLLPEGPYFQDTGAGGSAIYGPDGKVIAKADKFETMLTAPIPIAEFRARHLQPDIHWDLVRGVFDGDMSRFAPNLFSEYQPESHDAAARYVAGRSRWS